MFVVVVVVGGDAWVVFSVLVVVVGGDVWVVFSVSVVIVGGGDCTSFLEATEALPETGFDSTTTHALEVSKTYPSLQTHTFFASSYS